MRATILFSCWLLATISALSQTYHTRWPARFQNLTYANGQSDTTGSEIWAAASKLAFVLAVSDSAMLDVHMQYKDSGATWTTFLSDSLLTSTAAGSEREIVLRTTEVDHIPGFVFGLRVIVAARATGNGVTSPRFSGTWYLRP